MKNLKYAGWVISFVLLGLLIFVFLKANSTSAKLNDQLRAQADNFTATYAGLVAQQNARDAQWQTTLNATIAAHDAQWQTALDATVAARDTYWKTALDAANATMIARDVQWQNTLDTTKAVLNAQWQATLNSTVTAYVNYYNAIIAQLGGPR